MSKIEVNTVEPQCGTTLTLGACGDTVALGSGAAQTGFGRTGTVDWQTGDIKTAAFIPATGKGYFVNTTGGAVTVNLPAGSAGDIVGLKDYAGTWDTYAVTLNPNGSEKIGGGNSVDPTLTSEGGAVLLVYVDGTQGWLTTQESVTSSPSGNELFIVGTGGSPCTGAVCGDYKVHSFTGPGTFTVCSLATCAANDVVDYLVVAGGAGGATNVGGGYAAGAGGAGGMRFSAATYSSPSPLKAPAAAPVTATGYPITVGAGGGSTSDGVKGSSGASSIFSSITSAGGGGGGGWPDCEGAPGNGDAVAGGSGGGGARCGSGGAGNTPSSSPAQGSAGSAGRNDANNMGGGGGGLTAAGSNGGPTSGADGGAGLALCITGSPVAYGGGGGGGAGPPSATPCRAPAGGLGGGGAGAQNPAPPGSSATAGTVNTGGGGGGTNYPGNTGGAGGSGIVIIRYKFQ